MNRASERLKSLLVGDVMSRGVLQLSSRQTMSEIAEILVQHGISGAPVVDEHGRCVGILSASDFVRREQALRQSPPPSRSDGGRGSAANPDGDSAESYMSKAVQSVSVDASLYKAAQIMCVQHVHRLPVLDQNNRLIGLITSMDVMAAMINAIDEGEQYAS